MYPYVEQLVGYRGTDRARKIGGLVLEVKGDFCAQRQLPERNGRGDDYIEVSLTSPYRYNPLHNDLDAYALAYGIATLMTNLFGRGKEPFWQQASTNLVKFVILLHQVLDDYVTLFQVYEHVVNPDKLRTKIADGSSASRRGAAASSWTSASTCSATPRVAGRGTRPRMACTRGRTGSATSKSRSPVARSRIESRKRRRMRAKSKGRAVRGREALV
jgi:hypothetical protein